MGTAVRILKKQYQISGTRFLFKIKKMEVLTINNGCIKRKNRTLLKP
jgi:hypothetical protein